MMSTSNNSQKLRKSLEFELNKSEIRKRKRDRKKIKDLKARETFNSGDKI